MKRFSLSARPQEPSAFASVILFIILFVVLCCAVSAPAGAQPLPGQYRNDSILSRFVSNTGLQTLMNVNAVGTRRVLIVCTNTVNALSAFTVAISPLNNVAAPVTVASIAADYTSPVAPMVRASGSLVTLGVATGWFLLDTSGVDNVVISATSGNAAGSTISCWSSAS